LTELAARLPRLKNYNVAVREWRDQVVFLHRILPGGTDKSYGIQVARLAGALQAKAEEDPSILAGGAGTPAPAVDEASNESDEPVTETDESADEADGHVGTEDSSAESTESEDQTEA